MQQQNVRLQCYGVWCYSARIIIVLTATDRQHIRPNRWFNTRTNELLPSEQILFFLLKEMLRADCMQEDIHLIRVHHFTMKCAARRELVPVKANSFYTSVPEHRVFPSRVVNNNGAVADLRISIPQPTPTVACQRWLRQQRRRRLTDCDIRDGVCSVRVLCA